MASQWEEFYATHLPPTDFEDNRSLLKEFVDRHNKSGQRIVLVTVSFANFEVIFSNYRIYSQEGPLCLSNIIRSGLLTILVREPEEQHRRNTF